MTEELELPPDKPLTVAVSYDAGPPQVAYVEFVGVGDVLRDAPVPEAGDLCQGTPGSDVSNDVECVPCRTERFAGKGHAESPRGDSQGDDPR